MAAFIFVKWYEFFDLLKEVKPKSDVILGNLKNLGGVRGTYKDIIPKLYLSAFFSISSKYGGWGCPSNGYGPE